MTNPCPCQQSTPSTDGPTIWAAQHCRRDVPSEGSAWAGVIMIILGAAVLIGSLFVWALQ